jgi:hypothetical protein
VEAVEHRDMFGDARDGRVRPGPWFWRHPGWAVSVALALYGAVFALRLAVHGTTDAISLLFVFPIALLALAFGARVGWAAGALGVALLALWVFATAATLAPLGWTARATPMVLLGGLVGAASDRLRDAAHAERMMLRAQVRQREAAEINDAIIQRLAAAKWSLEAGDTLGGIALVNESIETAEALVADLLRGDADRARVREPRLQTPPR